MDTARQISDKKPALVIGGGISGLYSALNLARMGVKVVLVEKSPALGGALPRLFRTYPECACCRIYGEMLEVVNNPEIDVLTLAEVSKVERKKEGFVATVLQKPKYVNVTACIACGKCVEVCPETVNIQGGFEWGERKAIYIPYPQTVPYAYTIDADSCLFFRDGTCRECEKVCPTEAIKLEALEEKKELDVSNIIVASGFDLPDVSILNKYGYQLPNVVTSVEFERLMSLSGPTKGKVLCPGNGKPPEKIAWIQCVGSRDTRNAETSHCSSVCCMFAIKEAINAKELLGESTETDIYFMDVRSFGKHFEEYANSAQEQNVNFKYTRIHSVVPKADSEKLEIIYHNHETDQVEKTEYDLVILSTGLRLTESTRHFLRDLGVDIDVSTFAKTDSFNPVKTTVPGVYVCGSVGGPKDINDSMVEAGAAAAEVATGLGQPEAIGSGPETGEIEEETRLGVFLCDCPVYQIPSDQIKPLIDKVTSCSGVVLAESVGTLCTEKGKDFISKKIKDNGINRVVVTACALTIRRAMFEELLKKEGIKPIMLEMVDLSDHVSDVEEGSNKVNVFSLGAEIEGAISKLVKLPSIPVRNVPVVPSALVVGGGVSGMTYALTLADQGYEVVLVEKRAKLGGRANDFQTWNGESVKPYIDGLTNDVQKHPRIKIYLESEVVENKGHKGNFVSVISDNKTGKTEEINHGVIHLAVGAQEFKPEGYYGYGENPNVMTLSEFQTELSDKKEELSKIRTAVFIQCVGSRDQDRPYCSRVCCTKAIMSALELKKMNPDINVVVLHRDIRTYGLKERLYQEALASGVFFVRYDRATPPIVESQGDTLEVRVKDFVLGNELIFTADRVVLSTATVPNNTEISRIFSVDLDDNGFFAESHTKLKPVEFYNDAITMSGSAHAPKFLDESIAQAKAAAASAMGILCEGFVEVGGIVAVVDRGKCAVCCTCVRACPFDVPRIVDGVSFIDEALCKGCGACVAECPGKAISLIQYEEEVLLGRCRACLA